MSVGAEVSAGEDAVLLEEEQVVHGAEVSQVVHGGAPFGFGAPPLPEGTYEASGILCEGGAGAVGAVGSTVGAVGSSVGAVGPVCCTHEGHGACGCSPCALGEAAAGALFSGFSGGAAALLAAFGDAAAGALFAGFSGGEGEFGDGAAGTLLTGFCGGTDAFGAAGGDGGVGRLVGPTGGVGRTVGAVGRTVGAVGPLGCSHSVQGACGAGCWG